MQLALGTVQFGLAYGITGKGQVVPEREVRGILARAWERGVRTLDTAAAYGDIEARLKGLCEGRAFRVISKVPVVPDQLPASEAAALLARLDLSGLGVRRDGRVTGFVRACDLGSGSCGAASCRPRLRICCGAPIARPSTHCAPTASATP